MNGMSQFYNITEWYVGLHNRIMTAPGLEPLRRMFAIDPRQFTDLQTWRNLHLSRMQLIAVKLGSSVESLMVHAIDGYVRGELLVVPPKAVENSEAVEWANRLTEAGYVVLPGIGAGKAAEMRAHFEGAEVETENGRRSGLEEASGANVANYPTETVLACPHLVEIASDPLIVAAVERHLGTAPTILGLCAWWSFAGHPEARDAQLYHYDCDDYRFCKLFFYLTDVDEGCGPHMFFEGTHSLDQVHEMRRRWPGGEQEFEDWHFRKFRKSDDEVLRFHGRQPVALTGPAGSCFIVNTRGIHKGRLPEKRDRLVCQVLYGVTPMQQQAFPPRKLGTPGTGHIPDRVVARSPFDYVNRLFLLPDKVG